MKYILKHAMLIGLIAFVQGGHVSAQNTENFRSLDIRYGRTGLPGDIFKVVSERYLAPGINAAIGGFFETSNRNLINYNCYGLDIMGYYYTPVGDRTDDLFQLRCGLGATTDYEQEKNLYQKLSFSQKINGGVAGEVAGEWAFTQDFSLLLAYNQKYMFNKDLGSLRYDVSIGLKLKFY